jgi:hypothetical protein
MGVVNPGEMIEFCGYATRDGVDPFKSYQRPEPISLSLKSIPRPILTGRLVAPARVVLASGQEIFRTKEDRCPS